MPPVFRTLSVLPFALALTISDAEAADDEVQACAVAYYAAATERGRFQGMRYNGEAYETLLALMENGLELDYAAYEDRGRAIFGDEPGASGASAFARFAAGDLDNAIMTDGYFASSSAMLAPDTVFAAQREVFGRLNACDIRYGFAPVIGPVPTHAAVLQHYEDVYAAEREQEEARLAALTDQDCAIRFWITAASFQAVPEASRAMQQKVMVAVRRIMDASPGMTMERLGEIVQREGQAHGEKIDSAVLISELQQEVQACERRYDLPVTAFEN